MAQWVLKANGNVAPRRTARPLQVSEIHNEKVKKIRARDLELDLLPLFEQRAFIEAWIASFHANFEAFLQFYR